MKYRIVICLALLLAICLIGDVIAMLCLRSTIRQLAALAESHRIQSLRSELASSGARIETGLLASLAGYPRGPSRRAESIRRFDESLDGCVGCHHLPGVQTRLDRLHDAFHAYRDKVNQLAATGHATGAEKLDREAHELVDRIVRQSTELADLAEEHLVVKSNAVAASVHRAWVVLIGTLAALVVMGGFVAFHLKRRLTVPVEALLEGIEHVRRGDLSHRFSIDGDAEFRALGDALNQAYESVKSVQDGMLQAEKMAAVGKLAAGIAHEVCNPLASISSVAQMMRRDCTSDQQAERLDLIMQHITRVSRIVRELLTFSRPAEHRRQGRVEIGELLNDAVSLLRYDKRSGRTRIFCHYDADLHLAFGDADRLLLVFTNIMINAFDALSTRSDRDPRLTIIARRDDNRIVIRFEDNGPGMAQDQIRDAFEPFFTTKDPGAGTGLGLWVCYQVVRRHQGTIRFESRVGEGTAVIIELPTKPQAPGSGADQPSAPERQNAERVPPSL